MIMGTQIYFSGQWLATENIEREIIVFNHPYTFD